MDSMKTTIDIPEKELRDAIRFTGAKTKKHAVVTAMSEFNRIKRLELLVRRFGKSTNFLTPEELRQMREAQ